MNPLDIEGVGLVNQLPGTGGPPDPSRYRDELLAEIKRHDIPNPNRFLETTDTALVRVRATIPPGAQRGDAVDVRIQTPQESRATDLRGGWLLDTRLRQQQVLNQSVRKSEVLAVATGPVLVRADFAAGTDQPLKLEGNIIAGGRVQDSRKLGLVLKPQYHHAKVASTLANAINQRFFFFDGTTRRGVAKAIEDDFIELDVHPRYRDSIQRYMLVVRSIGGKPHSAVNQDRLAELGEQLKTPTTAADAALQLEAIGENAVPTLLGGLQTENPELKFYAAEALAYLDHTDAIEPLADLIRDQPAFRAPALLALEGFRDAKVIEALQELMDAPSLEARYGAFCGLRRREDGKRKLVGKSLSGFSIYAVPSQASPAVIVSLREEPEIVLMGSLPPLRFAEPIIANNGLMLVTDPQQFDQLKISRFEPGKQDQRIQVADSVAAICKGISDVGGRYGDVITVLRQAKELGYLSEQLAIDPLPKSQRTYFRDDDQPPPDTVGSGVDP
jgi:flagellar basal body P-ring protein FlgI